MGVVTSFRALTNQMHSARPFRILLSTFRNSAFYRDPYSDADPLGPYSGGSNTRAVLIMAIFDYNIFALSPSPK